MGKASRNQSASHAGCCGIFLDEWNSGGGFFFQGVFLLMGK